MFDEKIKIEAGRIFIWNNYPFFELEEKERRWFLFLGHNTVQGFVFQVTTTTQYQYYKQGGKRAHNNFFST